ncbi:MAG: hypothetical protein K0Q55_2138 [Verrucomicrobia bacterium]|jgi:hypothetical protein|nr:hypothetical protein [Verrucomicrobiota bacterium]
MNTITAILTLLAGVLQLVLPLMFTLALFLWWRRLRHWSFAVLAVATAVGFLAQAASFIAINLRVKSPGTDIDYFFQASSTLNILMILSLFAGAIGLFHAVKDNFMFEEAKRG